MIYIEKKNRFVFYYALILAFFCVGCSEMNGGRDDVNPAVKVHGSVEENNAVASDLEKTDKEIDYSSIIGKWNLIYSGNYGYFFRFQKNYKSIVTLFLGNEALVFKGVYSVDKGNVAINIYEMKREKNVPGINYSKGFQKANSSSFAFKAAIQQRKGKKILKIIPVKIIIDGNDSDGYFEPLIKLNYSGS